MKNYLYLFALFISFFALGQDHEPATSESGVYFLKKAPTATELKMALAATENNGAAVNYFVKPLVSGTNEGTGTQTDSFNGLQTAADFLASTKLPGLEKGKIYVYLFPGNYDALSLDSSNSGRADNPIIYKALIGRKYFEGRSTVTISKGVDVPFSKIKIPPQSIIDQVPSSIKSRVRMVDIADVGLTTSDIEKPAYFSGNGRTSDARMGRIYINSNRLDFGSYPARNADGHPEYINIESVINFGNRPRDEVDDQHPPYPIWTTANDMTLQNLDFTGDEHVYGFYSSPGHPGGYPKRENEFIQSVIRIRNYDPVTDELALEQPAHYGIDVDDKYYLFNNPAFMVKDFDMTYDIDNGLFYFVTPVGFDSTDKVQFSTNLSNLVTLNDADNLIFDGFDFELTRGDILSATGTDNVQFINCNGYNFEGNGFMMPLENVFDNRLRNIYIKSAGRKPFSIGGGNLFTQKASNSKAGNIRVENFGEPAKIVGVATKLVNYHMRHTPGIAISTGGNFTEILKGELFDIATDISDSSYIYMGRNHSETYILIDGLVTNTTTNPTDRTGMQVVYVDDYSGYVTVKNVITNGSTAGVHHALLKSNGGVGITLDNSIAMGGDYLGYYLPRDSTQWMGRWSSSSVMSKLAEVDATNPNSNWYRQNPEARSIIGTLPDVTTNTIKNSLHVGSGPMYSGIVDGSYATPDITVEDLRQTATNPFPNASEGDYYLTKQQWESEPDLKHIEYIDVSKFGTMNPEQFTERYFESITDNSE